MENKDQKPLSVEDQQFAMSSDDIAKSEEPSEKADTDDKIYPPKKVTVPAMIAVYLAVFLVSLVSLNYTSSKSRLR